jgi:hypothetical protein
MNKGIQRRNSISTVTTDQSSCSSSCDDVSSFSKVRFALNGEGEVHRMIHYIPKCKNPDLWWQADEVKAIRSNCNSLVKGSLKGSAGAGLTKATTKYLQRGGWKEGRRGGRAILMHMSTNMEIRGLEHSVIPVCRSVVTDHVRAVLKAQRSKRSLRAAAKETSQACSHLAVERARHDTTQALKAFLSRWTRETTAVCVD